MSQLDSQTKEIDGHSYEIFMLGPHISHDLLMDTAKMIGPAAGPLFDRIFSGQGLSGLNQELGSDFFSKAATALFSGLDKKIIWDVITQMSSVTQVDGKALKPIFEAHFRGDLASMYKWLAFAMQVQWSGCWTALVNEVGSQGGLPPTTRA